MSVDISYLPPADKHGHKSAHVTVEHSVDSLGVATFTVGIDNGVGDGAMFEIVCHGDRLTFEPGTIDLLQSLGAT